jgi:glucose-6-phosphate 1-dehydrogenase
MSYTFVLFGASGDLTRRKLVPALFQSFVKERLPADTTIVGMSRTELDDDSFRGRLEESTRHSLGDDFPADVWASFAANIHYYAGDVTERADVESLGDYLRTLDDDQADRIFYLATAPTIYERALENLGTTGLSAGSPGSASRVVIEKPFGSDLASARSLNEVVHQSFAEDQVFRIDHYLGKETVQNILVLRFANSIFEPVWNRNYIEHVEITVAEDLLVGSRGDYYDRAGVLRDMFQNHLLQLMMITAMEAPSRYAADAIRNEKVKILEATRALTGADFANDTVRGQYAGYLDEDGVAAGSQTATFAAIKLSIDNWRWQGVPFYLRSGKGMSCRTTQIVVQFRDPPQMLFGGRSSIQSNRLVIQIQPAEGIQLHFQTKVPDSGMALRLTDLDFDFRRHFPTAQPDAYERLLRDVAAGDASLFTRSDEAELAWKIVDPILAAWDSPAAPALEIYEPGLWGPESCAEWMRGQGREWFDVCPILH